MFRRLSHFSAQLKNQTDVLFLSLTVVLSSITYVGKIGFYSDDWSFLATLSRSSDQSLFGLVKAATNSNTAMRPVQNILDSILFLLFRTHPLGYQLASIVFLICLASLFYALLKKLRLPRLLCISVALVYVLLPNYSADRFWFAAFQSDLSSMLYFLSALAALQVLSAKRRVAVLWGFLSLSFLLLSSLAYEVIMPLYVFNVVVIGWLARKKVSQLKKRILMLTTMIVLICVFIFKAMLTTRLGTSPLKQPLLYPIYLAYLAGSATWSNFVQMPLNLVRVWFTLHLTMANWPLFLVASLIGLSVFGYFTYLLKNKKVALPSKKDSKILIGLGLVVFALGYGIFLLNNNAGFSPNGMDNRIAIVASMGVAAVVIGLTGWLGRKYFVLVTALVAMSGFLVINQTALSWADSYAAQKTILADMKAAAPIMPAHSTIILDGICPYRGPVAVFDANWDFVGAVQWLYQDPTLRADTVTPKMALTPTAITTTIYEAATSYPYQQMIIYNEQSRKLTNIQTFAEAQQYFQAENSDFGGSCPADQSDPPNNSIAIRQGLIFGKSILVQEYVRQHRQIQLWIKQQAVSSLKKLIFNELP